MASIIFTNSGATIRGMAKNDSEEVAPETAVRAYLMYLENPTSLVDSKKIAKLETELAATKDPIDRLMAMAVLHRAQNADPSSLISSFTKNARAWAAAERVPESAFRQLGVPDDVLRATFGKAKRGGPGKSAPARAARRGRVSADQIMEGTLALDGPFSIRDVSERVGGSPVTVKNVIGMLEAQGKIVHAGEKAGSRGRAAKTWTVAANPT
jgi:hypothetical protein